MSNEVMGSVASLWRYPVKSMTRRMTELYREAMAITREVPVRRSSIGALGLRSRAGTWTS